MPIFAPMKPENGKSGTDPLEDDAPDAPPPLDFEPVEDAIEPGPLARGAEVIKSFWKHAPMGPGCYRMIAADGAVLYVGKAKSIKKRVLAYTTPERQSIRIARMVALTVSVVFVTTATEAEALLLEANLIKQLKPRYNVMLRDDKSFPYILVTRGHEAPMLTKHRGARGVPGDYFGPFASAGAVFRTINALQRAFLLRTCSDSFYENRSRPCLQFQIKRCSAPCTGEIALDDYAKLVDEARTFLSGKSRAIRQRLAGEMGEAAAALEFETAARLRDRISALSSIQGEQNINPRTIPEADVFAIAEEAGQFCVEAFFFRTYQNWGNRAYFPRADRSLSAAEVLDSFLGQFYVDRPAPRLILVNAEVASRESLQLILSARMGHRVALGAPKRGEKRELVDNAERNAKQSLARRLAEAASQGKLLAALGKALGVDSPIRRVEVFDNSHIMGTNAIGAMIVAGPEGFVKNQYRTFNIKSETLTPGDDYGMMREVLARRFAKLSLSLLAGEGGSRKLTDEGSAPVESLSVKTAIDPSPPTPLPQGESGDEFPDRPDLVLIDGGRGQLEAARAMLEESGVTGIHLASIAKGPDRNAGRETFFVAGREPFRLPERDPALFFAQRLRDEAHRFGITYHRSLRDKNLFEA